MLSHHEPTVWPHFHSVRLLPSPLKIWTQPFPVHATQVASPLTTPALPLLWTQYTALLAILSTNTTFYHLFLKFLKTHSAYHSIFINMFAPSFSIQAWAFPTSSPTHVSPHVHSTLYPPPSFFSYKRSKIKYTTSRQLIPVPFTVRFTVPHTTFCFSKDPN